MKRVLFLIFAIAGATVFSQLVKVSEIYAACGPPTYAGCTAEQRRQIQSGQFYSRKIAPSVQSREVRRRDSYSSADAYWKDRQYQDRKDLEARNEREEARRLEAETRRYEAKQYSRQRNQYGGNVYINGYGSKDYRRTPSPAQAREKAKQDYYNRSTKKTYSKVGKGN